MPNAGTCALRSLPAPHSRYFDEISQDTGKYCFGVDDTLQCLDMGAVETLIVWENLEVRRVRRCLVQHWLTWVDPVRSTATC
jgi:peptide subunit release factor 1 (eRF1)